MKILNLYAGIGGNRKLWGDEHEITAVEYKQEIADIYKEFYPNDNVIVADAHQFLIDNYKDYDFIWSSPPCPSHSITRYLHPVKIYPDMKLYQEIILLQNFSKGKYVVENVIPYYKPLIKPSVILHRHYIWSNLSIYNKTFKKLQTCKATKEREMLQNEFGFNLDKYKKVDKRKLLRNCVNPELGLHILNCALEKEPEQIGLFELTGA
jgi:DNA (cytosine-5)-methyltransferase 1